MSKTRISPYAVEPEKAYTYRAAVNEATRCLLCEDAPCNASCPAGGDPAKFIRSLRFKDLYAAAQTVWQTNPFGGSCANVCPRDLLCEEACSHCDLEEPIRIGKIEKLIVEQEHEIGMSFKMPYEPNGKRVACIGAGPASLSCARELAYRGYDVTVYEAMDRPGGMLTYGILPSRLPQGIVDFDIAQIEKTGVHIVCNHRVDAEEFEEFKKTYDAVFVGVGLWQARMPDIPGADLDGVTDALTFLRTARTDTQHLQMGTHVVVIGCGDVAMDCASTAKQLGAETAIVYRRTLEEAPADMEELSKVMEMGVPVFTRFAPEEILGEDGKVTALVAKGRDDDSSLTLVCDQIVYAIGLTLDPSASVFATGQAQDPSAASGADGKAADPAQRFMNGDGVFFGGDMLSEKGRSVVEAVADGKAAAEQIRNALASTGTASSQPKGST